MDEILDDISPRDNIKPKETLDIHEEPTLELEKDDDIYEHGSFFIDTSSSPCSYEKSLELISLSNTSIPKTFNPLELSPPIDFERVVVDAFIYHKYSRSYCHES